jgi:cytochrome P450
MTTQSGAELPVLAPGPPRPGVFREKDIAKAPRGQWLNVLPESVYRDPFIVIGGFPMRQLMVNTPEGAKRVLLDNVANYPKTVLEKRFFSMIFGNGLLSSDGDVWRAHRRAMAPSFSPQSVAAYSPKMAEVARAFMARWDALPEGAVVDIGEDMLQVALQIISQTLFSTDSDEIVDEVAKVLHDAGAIRPSLPEILPIVGEFFRRRHEKKLAATFARFDTLAARFIAEREVQMKDGAAPHDLLGRLIAARDAETGIAMTPREVRDQLLTIFLAGHETTAASMTWTWYVLSQRPEVVRRLQAELDTVLGGRAPAVEDAARLTYTRAVVEEVLRLYPAAPALSTRQAQADDVLDGRPVKKGDLIAVSPWMLQRHEALWDDPQAFRPERFLPGQVNDRHRFAYIPFGAGPRICIGMQLALNELVILLATFAQRYSFDLAPGQEVILRHQVTLRPEGGLRMVLRRREVTAAGNAETAEAYPAIAARASTATRPATP